MQDLTQLINDLASIGSIILSIGLIILIWILGRFIKFAINRMKRIPPDAKNGINLGISLFQFFLLFIGTALIFNVDPNFLLGSSAVIATAIGFSSTQVAANIVGGLYIIATKPFGIGDLITIFGKSGLVLEIGLSYTKLLQLDKTIVTIPNSQLLNATLLNSNISMAHEHKVRDQAKSLKFTKVSLTLPDSLLDTFESKELIRYSSTVQLKLNQLTPPIPLIEVKKRLDKVCTEFVDVFGFRPRYYFGSHVFRQDTHLVVTTLEVDTLFEHYPAFMEAMMVEVFKEIQ
ncbi:MAG: mechanosensitive ion channel family protein [Candidatus Heimdallarchaeota archaeon]